MVEPDDLKSVLLLSYLTDAMLKKVAEIAGTKTYRPGDYIFREGRDASQIYAIFEGKVGLEIEKNSNTRILVDTLFAGRIFGFSALVDTEEKKYTSSAKAMAETKTFFWEAKDLETLFRQDNELGLLFMKRIAKIIKTRLQIRNIQFLDIYR